MHPSAVFLIIFIGIGLVLAGVAAGLGAKG